jgi:HMG (high mobility group) box
MDTLAEAAVSQTSNIKDDKENAGDDKTTIQKEKGSADADVDVTTSTDNKEGAKDDHGKTEKKQSPTPDVKEEEEEAEEEDSNIVKKEPDVDMEEAGEEDSTMNETVESTEVSMAAASKEDGKTVIKAKKTPVKRRKKTKKPPNYPKRPLSAYNIFFKDTREKIITEHGKTNFQEMVRLIASHWREVSDEQKKKYEEMAAKDLIRYKKEVSSYEKDLAEKKRVEQERQALLNEKNREQERKLVEAMQKKSVEGASGVRLVNGRFEEGGEGGAAGGLGARFPFGMGREEAMMAAMGGGGRELEMARLRLEQDLRGLEEARALRLRQLELAHMQGGAGGLRGAAGMFGGGGGGLNDNLELELQRRYLAASGGGGEHLGMTNEHELRQRLAEEQLLRESNFGASLGLGGRFGAYGSPLGGMGGHGMGLGNPYEEILLREQMLRREREMLLGGGGAASLYGGGLGAGGLGALGLGGSAGLWGANSAVADADMHTNAAAAGLASLRGQQSSYLPGSHLERLSDDELRALSSGRGLDAFSKGASAFKRVDGEAAKEGIKGEKVEG